MMDGWIMSSVLMVICAAACGLGVTTAAIRRAYQEGRPTIMLWLVGAMAMFSIAAIVEQSRVLAFRVSYEGILFPRSVFIVLYNSTLDVTAVKLLMATALTIVATLKIAILNGADDRSIKRCVFLGVAIMFGSWVALALALEHMFPCCIS